MDATSTQQFAEENDVETHFQANILGQSSEMPENAPIVSGIEFNNYHERNITVAEMIDQMANTGYQASAVSEASRIVNVMKSWPRARELGDDKPDNQIFLGFTSNLVSSGLRETLRWVVEHKHVTRIVATAGGVEEDIIKCLKPTYLSTFDANDAELRASHINRIGNLRVPNDNYAMFEDWITPIFEKMLKEQEVSINTLDEKKYKARREVERGFKDSAFVEDDHLVWTPTSFIRRLGFEIKNESSICYWAAINCIPIYCPALTDGSIGDMLSQFNFRLQNRAEPAHLTIDIAKDIEEINIMARRCQTHGAKMGAVILGGGIVKHHIMNACLQGAGADAAVYVNTAVEYDGSDAGARPSEAVSWGKLKEGAESVKVFGEATVIFPLIVAGSWAKYDEGEWTYSERYIYNDTDSEDEKDPARMEARRSRYAQQHYFRSLTDVEREDEARLYFD